MIYVGSSTSTEYDQELERVLVGPVPVGKSKFLLQTPEPDVRKIPDGDLLGVTVVLITCSYRGNEFIRVGYYVSNELEGDTADDRDASAAASGGAGGDECDEAEGGAGPGGRSGPVDPSKIIRRILSDKPRVTRFPIEWT